MIEINIYFISLGCPKNQVDADVMCHALMLGGHKTTGDIDEANIIIINTCGFIESAKQEAIDNILQACEHKRNSEKTVKVIVTGCLAQRYYKEIAADIPEVDAVVTIGANSDICRIIDELLPANAVSSQGNTAKESETTQGGISPQKTAVYEEDKQLFMPGGKRVISTPKHYAYLKIADGCNNNCHYCAIPLIRGTLRSRSIEDVVEEAKFLAEEGVKELILVAQDVTVFGLDTGEIQIAQLLSKLNEIDGIKWIRLLYAYPERITDEFVRAMVENEKVLHYLDIPIQHINSEVLKNMNRKGNRQTIESALKKLRNAMPDITLRTTVIAGFPGETDEQFDELCEFIKQFKFDRLGCFAYSEEEGTVAAKMEQMPLELRQKRADIVMGVQTRLMGQMQSEKIGKKLSVICDTFDDENNLYICRSHADAPEIDAQVCVRSEEPIREGEILDVLVEESDEFDLYAARI